MMMNPSSSPSPRWMPDFIKKHDSKGAQEKRIGGFYQESLFSQSSLPRGYHDHHHDWIQKSCVAEEKERKMAVGLVLSQGERSYSYLDLMQNCDLPSPIKLFSGTETTILNTAKISTKDEDDVFPMDPSSLQYDEKLDLLKALQLSQTRAREAEKKAMLMAEERNRLSNTLLEESLRLLAHRQWVRLLELEVVFLRSQKQQFQLQQLCHGSYYTYKRRKIQAEEDNDMGGWTPWFMALALCLGFASLGELVGYRNLF